MKTKFVALEAVRKNQKNPRLIKDAKFRKLVQSVKEFPEMLKLRPIVVDSDYTILGGNMRWEACKEAGLTKVHIVIADDLSEAQKKEFIIKDNVGFGEWDWEILANQWDEIDLTDWGMDLPDDFDHIKETKDLPKTGELEFADELLLEHNYVVLYFDNPMDWEVAKEHFGLKKVKSKTGSPGSKKIGLGLVVDGSKFIGDSESE